MAEPQDRRKPQARRLRVRGAGALCAAASSAISVSALASTTMSPGVWPRSTAAAPSAMVPGSAASRCISQPSSAARDRGAVEALAADHDEPRGPRLAGAARRGRNSAATRSPTACTTCRRSRPGTSRKPLTRRMSWARISRREPVAEARHRRRPGRASTTKLSKSSWSCSPSRSWHDGRRGEIVLGRGGEARAPPPARPCPARASTSLHARAAAAPAISRRSRASRPARDQVGLVEHDEVGAGELVVEHLLERIVVVDRRVGGALRARRASGSSAKRPAATAAASITVTTPSTVTRVRISGQAKACTSGFGSARPEVSIDDVVGRLGAVDQAGSGSAGNRRRRCSRCSRWPAR